MRLVAGILLVAACGGRATSSGPPWPKSAGHVTPDSWEEDGGESLAPRAARDVAAVESSAEEPEPEPEPETTVEVTPEPPPEDAPVPPPEETPPIEVPGETIIIEGDAP